MVTKFRHRFVIHQGSDLGRSKEAVAIQSKAKELLVGEAFHHPKRSKKGKTRDCIGISRKGDYRSKPWLTGSLQA